MVGFETILSAYTSLLSMAATGWLACPVTDTKLEGAYRAHAQFVAHDDDPEFGYRFLVDEVGEAGEPMAARTAWRICSENGWWSAFGKPKARGHGKKPGPPVHDDLCAVVDEHGVVRHRFNATAPNDLWLTDITEHRISEGKLYPCAVNLTRLNLVRTVS